MNSSGEILIIDDDIDTCRLLTNFLSRNGYSCQSAFSGRSGLDKLSSGKYDLVITDFRLGDMDGLELIGWVRKTFPVIPVLVITGYSDIKTAVNVIKAGALNYIAKPLVPAEILLLVSEALNKNPETEGGLRKQKEGAITGELYVTGHSSRAIELEKQVSLVAPTNFSVIIYGETGSGKEVVARTIHRLSERSGKPFVAVDCGALSRELAGSELFGHEKGAFTGAHTSKTGHFEQANGGTLFLDEVGNLSYDVQVSLLRVIQERKLRKLGSNIETPVDVRMLVASNEDLKRACQAGTFREDLYYRLNEFRLDVPALRERQEDIHELSDYFLREACAELRKTITGFSGDVMEAFLKYSWPGNIRELKNVIKRAALLSDKSTIQIGHIPLEISHPRDQMQEPVAGSGGLRNVAQQAEYESILEALKKVNYNKTRAARLLDIDRKTLYNKMKAFNLLPGKN